MDSNNGNKISQLTIDSDGISSSDTVRDSEVGLNMSETFTKKDDALAIEDLLDVPYSLDVPYTTKEHMELSNG